MKTIFSTLIFIVGIIIIIRSPFAYGLQGETDVGNIVETASSAGKFETLLSAAKAAGLAPALTSDGPLTVFAPTDDAFNTLPAGTIESLLKEENRGTLKRILTYHVVSGRVGSDALSDGVSLKTLAGPRVVFTQSEGGFTVEGASIVATDIIASNGVVHVIDRVIMPPKKMSRSEAEQLIMSAINRGAPMFNHGDPQATANIYQMAAETLVDNGVLMPKERKWLETALSNNSTTDSAEVTAWKLRYALDDVLASMRTDLTM
jgi:uncharacterized surface protein with fasciclin (FAS1) repeats